MKVFVAGASGAIERLTRDRHEVAGRLRPTTKPDWLRQLGAKPVQVDAFDRTGQLDTQGLCQPSWTSPESRVAPGPKAGAGTNSRRSALMSIRSS